MEMSDEEILREADRIRARRGLRIARECAHCGDSFLATGQETYCSDACRASDAQKSTGRPAANQDLVYVEGPRQGESTRDFVIRKRAEMVSRGEMTEEQARLTDEDERFIAASERLDKLRQEMSGRELFDIDSTEILRREREKRSRYIAELHGWDE